MWVLELTVPRHGRLGMVMFDTQLVSLLSRHRQNQGA
jgi:hypothetical protein